MTKNKKQIGKRTKALKPFKSLQALSAYCMAVAAKQAEHVRVCHEAGFAPAKAKTKRFGTAYQVAINHGYSKMEEFEMQVDTINDQPLLLQIPAGVNREVVLLWLDMITKWYTRNGE